MTIEDCIFEPSGTMTITSSEPCQPQCAQCGRWVKTGALDCRRCGHDQVISRRIVTRVLPEPLPTESTFTVTDEEGCFDVLAVVSKLIKGAK